MFLFDREKNPDQFVLMPGQLTETQSKLDAGVYNLGVQATGQGPPIFSFNKTTKYDDGMFIEGGVFTQARSLVDRFIKTEMYEARKVMGMMHKIGIIFDGKPGTGKTFLAGQICSQIAKEYNAVCLISTQHKVDYPWIIDNIREFDKDRLIVLVMDEFEKSPARHYSEMLSFLDGSDSKDNVIILATINDITEMPSYLKDRPGRFEHILKFRSDDKLVLKSIITQCIPASYREEFNVELLVKEFTDKSNSNKFGLKNERDDFTVDRLRIVIRDLIAEKIRTKPDAKATDKIPSDMGAQVKLATAAMESVEGTVAKDVSYENLTLEGLEKLIEELDDLYDAKMETEESS